MLILGIPPFEALLSVPEAQTVSTQTNFRVMKFKYFAFELVVWVADQALPL